MARCCPASGSTRADSLLPALRSITWCACTRRPRRLRPRQGGAASAFSRCWRRSSPHVVPEFLGNRAPNADPDARATLLGLGFDTDTASLARLYLAGLGGLAYGARQIVDALDAHGAKIETIVISGGAGQSDLVRRLLADATGRAIAIPEADEPVLLGAAMLGAVAAGAFPDTLAAIGRMSRLSAVFRPAPGAAARIHAAKYAIFLDLQRAEMRARAHMAEALES